jgi:uncharacterized membrane protein YhaH (DUF805 family)
MMLVLFLSIGSFDNFSPSTIIILLVVGIPLYLALVWVQICLTVKRLHDLNKSGWWMLAIFGVSFLSGFLSEMGEILALVGIGLNVPILVYALWLLFWPGTKGNNKYGPDPIEIV